MSFILLLIITLQSRKKNNNNLEIWRDFVIGKDRPLLLQKSVLVSLCLKYENAFLTIFLACTT